MRLLILTLLLVITPIKEGTGAQLNRISKSQTGASVQIYTYFDKMPVYRQRFSDKRLDLTFLDTISGELLKLPEPDDIIVKTLVVKEQGKTILSFFFRYTPQDLVINADRSDFLVVDLIPGNRFTGTYRELRTSLGKVLSVPKNRKTIVNPLTFSLYGDDWLSFFEEFEITPIIHPRPMLYFPPFPLTSLTIAGDSEKLDESLAVIEEVDQMDWFESLRLIQKQLKSIKKGEERKFYAIAHADILSRLGSALAALDQFNLLHEAYSDDIAGDLATYAGSVIEARNHEYYSAQTKLRRLFERLPELHPLLPYVHLALAEIALATKKYNQMKQHLDSLEEAPSPLKTRVQLRTADLAFATGHLTEAFTIYRNLYHSSAMMELPYSVSSYCSILFSRQIYDLSSKCYENLASLLDDQEQSGYAHYLATLSEMKNGSVGESSADRFSQIIERYPDTSAALKAEIKQADICYLQQDNCTDNIQSWYRNIADRAAARDIAQEASFKEAIVYHREGDDWTSIQLLTGILRTFRSGSFRDYVQSLLIQIIPGQIERFLAEGQEIKAIALAQQNRSLFELGWLDDALLFRIGLAFEKLAMYPEALQLFLFLKNHTNGDGDENTHLASTRAAHALGEYLLVEDLAAEYFYRYPEGKYQLDILFFQLDCRYAVGHIDEALKLLPSPLPQREDFRIIAAALYFHESNYARTIEFLLPIFRTNPTQLSEDHLYMLAESLFYLESFGESSALFEKLATTDKYRQSARHRRAQLAEALGIKAEIHLAAEGSQEGDEQDLWLRFTIQNSRYKNLLSTL